MNQDVFLMHFEGRLCQQNSRIPVFVRKLFVYFVIRKEIEHKNVKRQVLEPLPANGSLKKISTSSSASYAFCGIMQWFNESQGLPFLNYSADLNELFSFCSPLPTLQLAKQPAS